MNILSFLIDIHGQPYIIHLYGNLLDHVFIINFMDYLLISQKLLRLMDNPSIILLMRLARLLLYFNLQSHPKLKGWFFA